MQHTASHPIPARDTTRHASERRLMVKLARHLVSTVKTGRGGSRATQGTYASRRISALTFAVMPPLHTLPPGVQAQQRRIRAAVAELQLRLERAPCARELAAALDWPIADLFHAMLAAGAGGLRAGDPPIEALDDSAEAAPGAGLHLRVGGSPRQRLSALLSGFFDLGDREQLVLLMLADRRMAHDDAARAFGDTTERVRQLHDGAVGKLLRHLTATPASH